MTTNVSVTRLAPDRLDDLEALWAALYDHHRRESPHLRERERTLGESWRDRRALEERWLLSEPASFVLVAESAAAIVGYAFVRVIHAALAVSWEFSNPHAELATLSVAPRHRGQGIGTLLMSAVRAELDDQGITDLVIAVVTTNLQAARFYERLGAVPFLTTYVQHVASDPRVARMPDHDGPAVH